MILCLIEVIMDSGTVRRFSFYPAERYFAR